MKVVAAHNIDGSIQPQTIILATGAQYEIEEVGKVRTIKDFTTHEIATQYEITVKGKETYLYEDCGRWFVLMRGG